MQSLPPSRPIPMTPSPLLPTQQTPPDAQGAAEAPDASIATERPGVPAPRHAPGGRWSTPGVRTRVAQPDAIVFTAPCPACGADCDWTEQREDTRLTTSVTCSCG